MSLGRPISLTIRAACVQVQVEAAAACRGSSAPAGPKQNTGSGVQPQVSPRLIVLRDNFVVTKPAQLLSRLPQQLPTGSSFWLFPQCFRLNWKLDILGHSHNWIENRDCFERKGRRGVEKLLSSAPSPTSSPSHLHPVLSLWSSRCLR